jgi:hypothetical protein
MNENEMIDLTSLIIDLKDENSVNSLTEKISDLKESGYGKVMISIKTSPGEVVKIANLDINIFEKIKSVQELPDFVVINLLQVAGKLKESNFKDRFNNE